MINHNEGIEMLILDQELIDRLAEKHSPSVSYRPDGEQFWMPNAGNRFREFVKDTISA